mmetsp:Transcript_9508/g.18399  ORF Transcript_9508/g.18399 Transcript_9508/m.18399 type:complete len:202 (+) Transcript_9508:1789-2394(+)
MLSLVMNSNSPSVPNNKNLSSLVSLCAFTSGVAETPTRAATTSPNDRDIASPGTFSVLSHTRAGPTKDLSSFIIGSTLPPCLRILALSRGSSGLWSIDRGIASQEFPICLPINTRESPTLAQNTSLSLMRQVAAVVPENTTSMSFLSCVLTAMYADLKEFSSSMNLSTSNSNSDDVLASDGKASSSRPGKCLRTYLLASWP